MIEWWPGIPAQVAFANADSLFMDPGHASDARTSLTCRASLPLTRPGVVVSYQDQLTWGRHSAPQVITVTRQTGDLCDDLLKDAAAFDALLRATSALALPWSAWAQVYTPAMDTLAHELAPRGMNASLLPECSGVSVNFWNSKLGGAEILSAALGDEHPRNVACANLAEAAHLLSEPSAGQYILKPDRAMGGAGARFVDGSSSGRNPDEIVSHLKTQSGSGSRRRKKAMGEEDGPFVLQALLGDPKTNVSPTADFWVDAAGTTTFVAIAEQILEDRLRYVGCRYPGRINAATIEHLASAGTAIGSALHQRGYRGLFNVDAVVTVSGQVGVIEMNVRQSAPLDQTLIVNRARGARWRESYGFVAVEAGWELPPLPSDAEILQIGPPASRLVVAIVDQRDPSCRGDSG